LRTAILVIVAVILLFGCTTANLGQRWTKAETTFTQATRDDWECARQAAETPEPPDLYIGGMADAVRVVLFQQRIDQSYAGCMSARGYQPVRS
jgi:hypothetical protein